MAGHLAAFLGVSAIVIVTPGPDTALSIRNTLMGGRRAGVFTAFGVFSLMTLVWLTAYALVVARARDVLRQPVIRRVIEAVTGAVLVALGVRLATERR